MLFWVFLPCLLPQGMDGAASTKKPKTDGSNAESGLLEVTAVEVRPLGTMMCWCIVQCRYVTRVLLCLAK